MTDIEKKRSREQYISKALADSLVRDNVISYGDWLASHSTSGRRENELNAQKNAVISAGARRFSGYGKNAENTGSMGLSGSGYSDFLTDRAVHDVRDSIAEANEEISELEPLNREGYARYLSGIVEKFADRKSDALDKILSLNSADYDAAYLLAKQFGLTEEDAEEVASAGTSFSHATRSEKAEIMKATMDARLDYYSAYSYAVACGLSPSEAAKIARTSQHVVDYFDNRYGKYE